MSDQRYYLRERGNVTGPYDLAQLRQMRQLGGLARFVQISADRETWSGVDTLEDSLRADAPLAPRAALQPAPGATAPPVPPMGPWYYLEGTKVHGPITAAELQRKIDRGEIGRECSVRPASEQTWRPCGRIAGFAFAASPAATEGPTAPPAPGRFSRPWAVGAGVGGLVGLSIVCAVLFAVTNRPGATPVDEAVPDVGVAVAANGAKLARSATEAEVKSPPLQAPVVAKEPGKAAAPAPRPEVIPNPPEPRPEAPPEVRSVSVDLPRSSPRAGLHDGNPKVLLADLPPADRYLLTLRGLDDPEIKDLKLASKPDEEGAPDTLVVIQDGNRGSANAAGAIKPAPLARFWVEGGQLKFRWAPEQRLLASQVAPAQVLRDCILEVAAGRAAVRLALRSLLSDPRAVTLAEEMPRRVDWGRVQDQPGREVVIRACQARIDGKWLDMPAKTGDPNLRELAIKTVMGGDGTERALTVRAKLVDRGMSISCDKTPALINIRGELVRIKKMLATTDLRFKKLSANLSDQEAGCRRMELEYKEQTRLNAAESGNPQLNAGMAEMAAQLRQLKSSLDRETATLNAMRNALRETLEKRKATKAELDAQTRLREAADNYQDVSIRLKLGIRIGDQEFDVATIGPWTD